MQKSLFVLVLVGSIGCGDDGGGGGGAPLPVGEFASEMARISCAIQFDCCSAAEIMEMYDGITYDDMPIETEAQCVEFATALLSSFAVASFEESIAQGRVVYDADAAGNCLAGLEGLSCDLYGKDITPLEVSNCQPFLIPQVGDGGACTQDFECLSNNCVGEMTSLGEDPVDGACEPLPGPGDACDDNCPDGYFCEFSLDSSTETCQPKLANGEDCFLDDDCESDNCDDNGVCAEDAPLCTGD